MEKGDIRPAAPGATGPEHWTPRWSRSGLITLWVILGAVACGVVAHLIGQALLGTPDVAAGIGIGAGVALGAAIGSRRADANDREVARRLDTDRGPSIS